MPLAVSMCLSRGAFGVGMVLSLGLGDSAIMVGKAVFRVLKGKVDSNMHCCHQTQHAKRNNAFCMQVFDSVDLLALFEGLGISKLSDFAHARCQF